MNKQESGKTPKAKPIESKVTITGLDLSVVDFKPVSNVAFSNWVRALALNWRQGTVACKGRSDVNKTGKKPWKQKGTGRARAGSFRSPLWRGGGVTFGPQSRTRTLDFPRQAKKRVLGTMLFEYLENKRIMSLDWTLQGDKPKTSEIANLLKQVGLQDKKVLFFLPIDDFLTRASCANIANINVLFFDQANSFDLANSEYWLYLKKDSDTFKDMVSRWI